MFNRRKVNLLILLLLVVFSRGFTQNTSHRLSGQVLDKDTEEPLSFVNVLVSENQDGLLTDSLGYFLIEGIPKGHYHIYFSHVGCDPQEYLIDIEQDTNVVIYLNHAENLIHTVIVKASKILENSNYTQSLNRQRINDNSNKNLATLLEEINGVAVLKNGTRIAKPIVQGLYGNRLTILNNGIAQSGQQWGNDHSPEIDPLTATSIEVVKGAAALAYPKSNQGAIILVKPPSIAKEPHLHGRAAYFFESNGRGHTLHSQFAQNTPNLAWQAAATARKSGDLKAPNYFLTNTGAEELSLALQLQKNWKEKFFINTYFSTFNTRLGVLRGAHIGNLTDLEAALEKDVPFFTQEKFSYTINTPYQAVSHYLAKAQAKYFYNENKWWEYNLATQYNDRKEYDTRRGDRSEIPALSLQQWNIFSSIQYHQNFKDNQHLKTGFQSSFINNKNNPETGILPLVPDYFSYENALFILWTKQSEQWFFDAAIRYEWVLQNSVVIDDKETLGFKRYNDHFHNTNASIGTRFLGFKNNTLGTSLSYTTRNPAINERFSGGLHQGVSGIEEGDPGLDLERCLRGNINLQGAKGDLFSYEMLVYFQYFENYTYLNPQNEFRLTIRGAFPVFRYEQTDAILWGSDAQVNLKLTPHWQGRLAYSYLRADDLLNENGLVNIPANRFRSTLSYDLPKWGLLRNATFSLHQSYVFRQFQINEEQDFLAPPEGYYLLGAEAVTDLTLLKKQARFVFRVENLLNNTYRDYLNRFRYFADETGINVTLGLTMKF